MSCPFAYNNEFGVVSSHIGRSVNSSGQPSPPLQLPRPRGIWPSQAEHEFIESLGLQAKTCAPTVRICSLLYSPFAAAMGTGLTRSP